MEIDKDTFARDWSLKWARGVVIGFAKGRLDSKRTLGMLRAARSKLGVRREDLEAILRGVEESTTQMSWLSLQERSAKFKPIREALARKEI